MELFWTSPKKKSFCILKDVKKVIKKSLFTDSLWDNNPWFLFVVQMICVKHFAWLRSGRKLVMEVVYFPSQWLNIANFSFLLWFICPVIKSLQGNILETNIKMSLMSLMWFQDIFYPVMDLIAVWRWAPIRMESVGIKNKGDL